MSAIKSILVPIDFSEISANSYRYALRLAGELSASVHLLHCLPTNPVVAGRGYNVFDLSPQLRQQAKDRFTTFVEEGKVAVGKQVSQMPEVNTCVSSFGLAEGIGNYQETQETDLIVMGTHGVQDNWDRFFGTHAALMVGKVQPPLLILPAKTEFRPLKTVCFATDLRKSDVVGAERVGNILAVFQPQIDFLHIHLPNRKRSADSLITFRKAFEQPRNGVGGTFKIIVNPDAITGIFSYLKKLPHDLLVMVKSDRDWWDRLFFSSDTKESARITSLPLLILGEQAGNQSSIAENGMTSMGTSQA